jgi:hypothetical protein
VRHVRPAAAIFRSNSLPFFPAVDRGGRNWNRLMMKHDQSERPKAGVECPGRTFVKGPSF